MKKSLTLKRIYLGVFFLLVNLVAVAQPVSSPDGTDGGDDPCFDTECVPIDSGVVFLLIAGSLLAVRLIYAFSKQSGSKA